ncbi:MAG: hypothetical protein ACFE8P_02015, partial [Promethearchaeota archaeon]
LAQATDYLVKEYFNQFTFAETTAHMISEIGYTEVLTLVSTAISVAATFFGGFLAKSFAKAVGLDELVAKFSSKTVNTAQMTALKRLMTKLSNNVLYKVASRSIAEAFQEIVMDSFIETFVQNLCDITGLPDAVGHWASVLATSEREALNNKISYKKFKKTARSEYDSNPAFREFMNELSAQTGMSFEKLLSHRTQQISDWFQENQQSQDAEGGNGWKSALGAIGKIFGFVTKASSLLLGSAIAFNAIDLFGDTGKAVGHVALPMLEYLAQKIHRKSPLGTLLSMADKEGKKGRKTPMPDVSSDIIIKSNIKNMDFSGVKQVKQAPTTIQNVPAFATRSLAEKYFTAEDVEKDLRDKELAERIEKSVPPEDAGILKAVKRRGIDQDFWKASSSEVTSKMDVEFILNHRDEIMLRTLLAYVKGKNAREQGRAIGDAKDIERLEFKLVKIEIIRRQKQLARIQGLFSSDACTVIEEVAREWNVGDFALNEIGAFLEDRLPEIASANLDTYQGFLQALELKVGNNKGLVRFVTDVIVKKASNGEILNQLEQTVFDWLKAGILKAGADQSVQGEIIRFLNDEFEVFVVDGQYQPISDINKWKEGSEVSDLYWITKIFYDDVMDFCVEQGILEGKYDGQDLDQNEMGKRLQKLTGVHILSQLNYMEKMQIFQLSDFDRHYYAWYAGIVNHPKFAELGLEIREEFHRSFERFWKLNGKYFESDVANEGRIFLYRIADLYDKQGLSQLQVHLGLPKEFYPKFYRSDLDMKVISNYISIIERNAGTIQDRWKRELVISLCHDFNSFAADSANIEKLFDEFDSTSPRVWLFKSLLSSSQAFASVSSFSGISKLFFQHSYEGKLSHELRRDKTTIMSWPSIQEIIMSVEGWTLDSFPNYFKPLLQNEAEKQDITVAEYVQHLKNKVIDKIERWMFKNPFTAVTKKSNAIYVSWKFHARDATLTRDDLKLESRLSSAILAAYHVFTSEVRAIYRNYPYFRYADTLNRNLKDGREFTVKALKDILADMEMFIAYDQFGEWENILIYQRAIDQIHDYAIQRGRNLESTASDAQQNYHWHEGYLVEPDRFVGSKFLGMKRYFGSEVKTYWDDNRKTVLVKPSEKFFDDLTGAKQNLRVSLFSKKWLDRNGFNLAVKKKASYEFLTSGFGKSVPKDKVTDPFFLEAVKIAQEIVDLGISGKERHPRWCKEMMRRRPESVVADGPLWYYDELSKTMFTGHPDLLAILKGMLWVLDYKPNLRFEIEGTDILMFINSVVQVAAYGAMACLMFGIHPGEVKCATVRENGYWEYSPLEGLEFMTDFWQDIFEAKYGEENPNFRELPEYWPPWQPLLDALKNAIK